MLNVLKKYLFGFAEKVCFHSRLENIQKYGFWVKVRIRNLKMSIGLKYVQIGPKIWSEFHQCAFCCIRRLIRCC